jgi:RNA polymerase sigma-70 factor (ECF subfamily)
VTAAGDARSTDSDKALLDRVVKGDESALAVLYDRYSGLVYSGALRITRDEGAAEEILQDTFYQVWRSAERFDPGRGSLAGWLLVAARNRAISRIRRKSGRDNEELDENKVLLPCNVESAAAQSILLQRVTTVLKELSQPQREAVELAYFEGMTHTEIATRTGEPLGTVKTRIRSAIGILKRALS